MVGYSESVAYGAATIVNAIALGKGAALGIGLKTTARVELTNEVGVIRGRVASDPEEKTSLIEAAVLTVLKHYHLDRTHGAKVETNSNIPVARGLKSSSVAANAVALAAVGALGKKIRDSQLLELSVNAATSAGTTITGAFDDTSASYFGGIVVTDNRTRRILKRTLPPREYAVVLYIPNRKAYTAKVDVAKFKLAAPQVETAFKEAVSGRYWHALTLNGFIHCAILGEDPNPALEALGAGATAAGLSGKGPATAAVVHEDKVDAVMEAWAGRRGKVVKTHLNREKSHITKME
ncbi:MAG: shikimate kinase [Candidatus Bathyarchaeia archaeon]